MALGEVPDDLGDGTRLRPGQVVGQPIVEALDERPAARAHLMRHADRGALELPLAPDELELDPQELVEDESPTGVGGGTHRVRGMDVVEGHGAVDQVEPAAELGIERIGEVPGPPQHLLDEPGDVPAHHPGLLALRVHGHDPPGAITDQVHDGVRHLPATLEDLRPPEEDDVGPLLELALAEGLVEEAEAEVTGAVGHVGGHE